MYNNFAYVYDKLMYDVDYGRWADFIEGIFRRNQLKPELVLDLGCGTGSFCMEMASRGYEMIGIDLSADMLSCAREKSEEQGLNILYLNQDMTGFELYGTVDAIVCLMDSINYITNKQQLKRVFKLVENYLNPGGLFIFDVNSTYKFESVLGNNLFYDVDEDITYLWQNHYNRSRKICEFDLTFFVKEDDDRYKKYEETHYERAYSITELIELAASTGLTLMNIYDELKFSKVSDKSLRNFFVYKK